MTKNCTKEIPQDYKLVKTVDAIEDKKIAIALNVVGTLLMLLIIAAFILFKFKEFSISLDGGMFLFMLIIFVSTISYIVLHELVHGLIYKILTKEKLTFGIALSCAFCGVPNVYVNKKTALCALFGPLVVFTIIFLPLAIFIKGNIAIIFIVLFAMHFGGCVGDMYCIYVLLFELKGDILMNDTGPKQTFYKKQCGKVDNND